MAMALKPPKCKTCGAEEWRHICGPDPQILALAKRRIQEALNSPQAQAEMAALADKLFMQPTSSDDPALLSGKHSRKEYLKLKARERRARQKAAK